MLAVLGSGCSHSSADCSMLRVLQREDLVVSGVDARELESGLDSLGPSDAVVNPVLLSVGAGRQATDEFLGELGDQVVVVHAREMCHVLQLLGDALLDHWVADAD